MSQHTRHARRPERAVSVLLVLAILATAALLGGCAGGPGAQATNISLTDSRGKEVQVPAKVERIVSMAPGHTEILYALGLGDRVVGVTAFCNYPPEAEAVEKVGDLMGMNVEKIASLEPDLVIAIEGLDEYVAKVEEAGIPVLLLQPKDLESVYSTIEAIGAATGTQEAAEALANDMRARIAAVEEKVKGAATRPTVFYELDATEPARPYTVGPGSWHDDFITMAGGENIAGDAATPWVHYSAEEIITKDPDLIILGDANFGVSPAAAMARPGWDVLSAVKNGAVYPINDDLVSRPGPRMVEGIEALAAILHPELFP